MPTKAGEIRIKLDAEQLLTAPTIFLLVSVRLGEIQIPRFLNNFCRVSGTVFLKFFARSLSSKSTQ